MTEQERVKRDLAIEQGQRDANTPKERLMEIANKLEEEGAIRQARSLETIIARLEEWQNK